MPLPKEIPYKNNLIKIISNKIYSCHEKDDPSIEDNWILISSPRKSLINEINYFISEIDFKK